MSNSKIEEKLGRCLVHAGRTLATAESCTGGLIAHRITNVAGASAYFLGGVVAYSDEVKIDLLGVHKTTLDKEGAVSEAVAYQMAEGARTRFGSDYALAVTGIAGPAGGSPEKPVGLVYIGVAAPDTTRVTRNQFRGARLEIKTRTADAALELLSEILP